MLLGAIAVPFLSAGAFAQSADTKGQLEEIVVTAQKRQESSQSVPIAITAFSADKLDKLNMNSVADLQQATPGLIINSVGGNNVPFLRGVGSPIVSLGADSSVASYVDGYYVSYAQGTMQEMYDAERVEVLKGPQAALYGRNATGGAINFISRKPSMDAYHAKVSASYGNLNEREFKAYLTGPIADGLAFSVAGLYRKRDSFIQVLNPKPAGIDPTEENEGVRAKLLWQPSDNYSAELTGAYSRRRGMEESTFILFRGSASEAAAIGAPVSYAEDDALLTGDPPVERVEQYMTLLTQELKLPGDLTLRSLSGMINTHQTNPNDPVSGSTVNILSFGSVGSNSRQYSQELQLLSAPNTRLTWIGGASYFSGKDTYTPVYTRLPLASQALGLFAEQDNFARQDDRSLAGYAEGTFHITDRLSITGGGRYTREKKELPTTNNYTVLQGIPTPSPLYDCAFAGLTFGVNCGGAALGLPPIPPAFVGSGAAALNGVAQPFAPAKKTWKRWSYRGTLQYQPAQDVSLYYTYSRGFKSGTFNVSALSTTSNVPVDPEILTSHEIGVKSELMEHRLRLNAAAFHYKIANTQAQVLVGGTSGTTVLANAGSATIKGAEAEVTYVPVKGLELSASGTYLHTRYNDFTNYPGSVARTPGGGTTGAGGNATQAINVVGNDLVFAAKFTSNLSATYTTDLPNGGTLVLAGLWSYNDGYCLEQACRGRQPSFNTVNASIAYTLPGDRITLTAYGRNITNSRHIDNYLQLPTGDMGRYSRPASGGVRVEYGF